MFYCFKGEHGQPVKNLIAGSGQQAVLPELGDHLTFYETTSSYDYRTNYQHLDYTAQKQCPPWKKGEAYTVLCPPGFYIGYGVDGLSCLYVCSLIC